ncbi:metabotropic glutamate receptor 2-like [Procambarus clarkii]|uniref:metabotropic glutamate receptor 2-like n=1 Tax=Procambarus clarkii TaxID=6728 RepID=UPI003743D84C
MKRVWPPKSTLPQCLLLVLLLIDLATPSNPLHTLEYDLRMLLYEGLYVPSGGWGSRNVARTKRLSQKHTQGSGLNITWPARKVVAIEGHIMLGGLMMVHERHHDMVCGPIMPQGGVQALEAMLYTLDFINDQEDFIPGVRIGTHILDDCDKDTYGLEQAVDFIKESTWDCCDGSWVSLPKAAVPTPSALLQQL